MPHGADLLRCLERVRSAQNTEESTSCTLSIKIEPDSRGSSPAMTMEAPYAHDSVTFAHCAVQWQNYSQVKPRQPVKLHGRNSMSLSPATPGIVGPFAGLDVPWLLRMRAESRRNHPFLIWAPFDAPARSWSYGEFHERVGALAAGLVKRGIRPGEYLLIHLDNCIEAMLAWFACVELGAIAVTTNT